MASTVQNILRDCIVLFEERNTKYGNSYQEFGALCVDLFPEGLVISTKEDWNRLGVLIQIVGKLKRYAANFKNDGHDDSLRDLSVYSAMMLQLDELKRDIPF